VIAMTFRAAKQGFFDRAKVKRSVDAATRRVLSKFGAFVRTRAKTSIRKKKGTSPPGSPPYSHTGLCGSSSCSPTTRAPQVGRHRSDADEGGESQAPRLLEHGGEAVIEDQDEEAPAPLPPPAVHEASIRGRAVSAAGPVA
jgi:hypothetical protein